MKRLYPCLPTIVFSLFFTFSHADIIYLTNGSEMKGIIIKETEDVIVLKISIGEMDIEREEIKSITRSNPNSKKNLEKKWAQKKRAFEKSYRVSQAKKRAEKQKKKYQLKRVEVYVTQWCPVCKMVTDYFDKNDVPYMAYDVDKDKRANARYKKLRNGRKAVPLVKIGDFVLFGLEPDAIRRALNHPSAWKER